MKNNQIIGHVPFDINCMEALHKDGSVMKGDRGLDSVEITLILRKSLLHESLLYIKPIYCILLTTALRSLSDY